MKKKFALLTILLSSSVFATEQITPPQVPKNIHIYDKFGATFVDMSATGCSGNRYYLNPAHVKYDAIISILLAAQLSNKKAILRFDDCVNGGNPQGNIVGVYLP